MILEMKVNLVKIDREERKKGKGFMQRIKEVWDDRCKDKPLTAQCQRDNAARFEKDETLMNLIKVRQGKDITKTNAETEEDKDTIRGEGQVREVMEQETNINRSEENVGAGSQRR